MILNSNAKINLGLFVTEKRLDGFHNLESIFLPIPLSDQIVIQKAVSFKFTSEGIPIPESDSPNLCERAFRLLEMEFNISPVHIHLNKKVPIGAGLGGGSSNAAFVLKGLNKLFDLGLTEPELEERALKLGSDCGFFIHNQPALVKGRGDELDFSLGLKLNAHLVLINPGIHISTQEAYAGISPKKASFNLEEIADLPLTQWKEVLKNDFEQGVIKNYPELKKLKEGLYESGAYYVSMTGSGSTYYALFQEKPLDLKINPNYLSFEFPIHIA